MLSAVLFLALATPADDALATFKAHCAGCHSPQAKKIKGKFSDVLDLPKIAADPKRLKKLATLVAEGDMPPEGEPPLSDAELKSVAAWVKSVAPESGNGVGAVSGATAPPSFLEWLGRFHILVLHFPLALVCIAGIREGWSMWLGWSAGWRGRKDRPPWQEPTTPSHDVQFCIVLAALFSIPTALLGWIHASAGNGVSQPGLLGWHRWLGTAAAVVLVLTAYLVEMDAWWGQRSLWTRVMVFVSAAVVGAAGHFGGLLVHGADFLEW